MELLKVTGKMLQKCYICLGKIGDILSILPILYAEYKKTGKRPVLVVSKTYSSVLEGAGYLTPLIYESNFGDVRGAVRFAKRRFLQVINLQMHGIDFEVEHLTPSFQTDAWLRARAVDHFQNWPLVIDQRSSLREKILFNSTVKKVRADGLGNYGHVNEKYLLVGDVSESSPFEHIEELVAMLKAEFEPAIRVIRLSEVKADRFFDLLGLYDYAECLITIETAHTHLSRASGVPVVVLAADGWRGAADRERFRFYCRYSEWPIRKNRLIFEVQDAIAKKPQIKIAPVATQFRHGYNLSSVLWEENLIQAYRYHEDNTWQTQIAIIDGDRQFKLKLPDRLAGFSVEDMRLFIHNGNLMAAYTVATSRSNMFFAVQAYGRLSPTAGGWELLDHAIIAAPRNDFSSVEKNWCPFSRNGQIYFIYGVVGQEQIVLQVSGDKVIGKHSAPAPTWPNGQIKGGSIIEHNGRLLRFFHSRLNWGKNDFRYFVGAAIMEAEPPFKTISVSTASILQGNEIFTPDCRTWKRNVIISYGAIKRAEKIVISVGVNDSKCATVELTEKDLKL